MTTHHDERKLSWHIIIIIIKMYVRFIDESKTLTGILFWAQSESKINLIFLSIIGSFNLFADVNEKFKYILKTNILYFYYLIQVQVQESNFKKYQKIKFDITKYLTFWLKLLFIFLNILIYFNYSFYLIFFIKTNCFKNSFF